GGHSHETRTGGSSAPLPSRARRSRTTAASRREADGAPMVVVRLQSRRVNAWRSRAASSCRLRIAPKERSFLTSRPRGCVACPDELGLIGGSRLDIVWTGPERGTWYGDRK